MSSNKITAQNTGEVFFDGKEKDKISFWGFVLK